MAVVAERVTINPAAEDPTLVPLDLAGLDRSWGIYLLEHDYTPPDLEILRSSSADTEGDPVVQSRYLNRTITAKVRVFEPSDIAATNLLRNPSAELNTTAFNLSAISWAASAMTRAENPLFYSASAGDFALHVTATKDATVTGRTLSMSQSTLAGTVTPGQRYTASAPINVLDNLQNGFGVRIDWYTAGAVYISSTPQSALFTGTGEQRVTIANQLAPATASLATVVLYGTTAISGDTVDLWTDAWQFEQGEAATAYFDGDTPGCDWTGARHASTSTRPAPDGTRFSRICRDVTRIIDGIKSRKSGTLRRISAMGGPLVYDLRTAKLPDAPQNMGIGMKRAEYGLSFEALPGGRGPEIQIGGNFDELTKPALIFLAENVPGELPALGRLVVEDRQAQHQTALYIGAQRDTYTPGADAELLYEAETRKPLGTSTVEALAGSSGPEGKAIKSGTLVNAYQGVMSTQAAAGNHLAHVGSYRVLARVQRPTTNTGAVSMKLAWTEGDFIGVEENLTHEVNWGADEGEGTFTLEDLGIVTINQTASGTQRWEGRILAKSTVAGDRLFVDCLILIPISEVAGEARASTAVPPATSFVGFDQFNQISGALTGKAAGIGGNWVGAGDADDFTVNEAIHRAQRTAVSDAAGVPRYVLCGATKYTDIFAEVEVSNSNPTAELSDPGKMGLLVRYVDANNWCLFRLNRSAIFMGQNQWYGQFIKKVAGVITYIGPALGPNNGYLPITQAPYGQQTAYINLELLVLASGDYQVAANGLVLKTGIDADLSSTGALKEGQIGLVDLNETATAATRLYDNFSAYSPTFDKAIFASRQFELWSNLARRQDREGLTWGSAPYEGDYLLVPQAGPEKRPTRVVVKASRNPANDAGIDDIRANLFVTPRYLLAPST